VEMRNKIKIMEYIMEETGKTEEELMDMIVKKFICKDI
jgi:hypothetical protein